jgi:hypothetical protein
MDQILFVGLEEPEVRDLRRLIAHPIVAHEMVPRVRIDGGRLLAEDPDNPFRERAVTRVVFHGIFENDLPLLAALALWGGPCLPSAHGMLDCRPRIPNLARSLRVTRFGSLPRGYADAGTRVTAPEPMVAKWGEWHCGENKARFEGEWECAEPTLFERFVEGEAVRVQMIGDRAWQVRLGGEGWKKSIHGPDAGLVPPDVELVADTRRLRDHFGLPIIAVDYMVGRDGTKYLLEVNHIPNVTVFPEMREAYLAFVAAWVA